MSQTLIFILFFIPLASAFASRFVPQQRTTIYNGGWALGLPSEGCPADAPVSCQDEAKDINPTCCPFGQTCFGFSTPYCCPTDQDCANVVNNVPVCANSTWNMYQLSWTGYICCEPGQVGMNPTSGSAGICEPVDQPVVSSLLATLASQIGGPPITTGPEGGAATQTDAGKTTTLTDSSATSTHTSGLSSSGSSLLHRFHLTMGEIVGIAVGGVVIIAALVAGIWFCCCRRRNRSQVGYAEPYRNLDGYPKTTGTGYNGGYSGYEGDSVPLQPAYSVPAVSPGYGQEYNPQGGRGVDASEMGHDEARRTQL